MRQPLRLSLAQFASRFLPLVGAHLVTGRIYGWNDGRRDRVEVERHAITGSILQANTADEYGYFFAARGYYDWKLLAIAQAVCQRGDTVVEVGANIGTETVGFADIVGPGGTVYAFEPLPANLARLRLNVGINKLENVRILPLAVSDREGVDEFVTPTDQNSGVGHIDYDGMKSGSSTVRVEAVSLDHYFGANVPARLLMMDVEGAEAMVLRGGRQWIGCHCPVVVLEAHHNRSELLGLLPEMGYKVYSIDRLGLGTPQAEADQGNWLALHEADVPKAGRIDRLIKICGLTPPLPWIHPLVGARRGNN